MPISKEAISWLRNWKAGKDLKPSLPILKELEPFKLACPTLIFRGLNQSNLKLKSSFSHRLDGLSSWTRDPNRAIEFGNVVLRFFALPEHSVVDFKNLPEEITKRLNYHYEDEILLLDQQFLTTVHFILDPNSFDRDRQDPSLESPI
jgi:hypothetical protein